MRRECLRLIFAENLHEFSVCGRDMSSIICRHHLCRCAGSICTRWFSIHNIYGAVWRNIQEPGFETVRHNRAKPRRPVLAWFPGLPLAVCQVSHVDVRLPQLPPLLTARPSSAWGPSHSPSVMPSMVAPSSPVQSPTVRKNVPTTCSLASRSSKAVAPSIWISWMPPPPSEHASSLAVDPGAFPAHSWCSTRSTATTSAAHGVRRAKSRLRCQLTTGFLDCNQGNPKTTS